MNMDLAFKKLSVEHDYILNKFEKRNNLKVY